MFTNLGNIYVNRPRETENTDARLGIGKHDKDQPRKKPKEGKKEEFFDEDSATVSVAALQIFLENFLKSQEAEKQEQEKQIINIPQQSETPEIFKAGKTNISPEAAQAAGAYAHTAQKSVTTTVKTDDEHVDESVLALGGEDVRKIHTLLSGIKDLQERKIEFLRIERSDSFLNSLLAAVEKAKNS